MWMFVFNSHIACPVFMSCGASVACERGWIWKETHSSRLEEQDSKPKSRARPWGWPEWSFFWSSSVWLAEVWWWQHNGRWRWPEGLSWRWCQTGRHRTRTSYILSKGKHIQTCNSTATTAGCFWLKGIWSVLECTVLESKKENYPSLQTPIPCRDSWWRRWATAWKPWGSH